MVIASLLPFSVSFLDVSEITLQAVSQERHNGGNIYPPVMVPQRQKNHPIEGTQASQIAAAAAATTAATASAAAKLKANTAAAAATIAGSCTM